MPGLLGPVGSRPLPAFPLQVKFYNSVSFESPSPCFPLHPKPLEDDGSLRLTVFSRAVILPSLLNKVLCFSLKIALLVLFC